MDVRSIEEKWQKFWDERKLFKAPEKTDRKYYVLEMFPYPSGKDLHMGHLKNYAIGDALARLKKMEGYDVLHPMGWDAFGLPAENAAIKHGIHPKDWTYENIEGYRETLKLAGMSYDWDREIATCDPEYYRWTQWIFLKLYERGLAYRKEEPVNYCPSCKTVLANEQVIDGKCERCKTPVIRKKLEQWFFRITEYAQRLLDDLEKLKGKWPDHVIKQQENWIGRSEGTAIKFKLEQLEEYLEVFTTRADTLFGVTFITIAPEHPIIRKLLKYMPNAEQVETYIESTLNKTEFDRLTQKHKEGVFTGMYALHPFTGEKIPIYVGDYVLYNYGTGIVMGVPAHDQRDFEFAKQNNLPIKPVIKPEDGSDINEILSKEAFEGYGILFNSGEFDGMHSKQAIEAIQKKLSSMGLGGRRITYRLRDWLISRQRYWGAPIPIIHCPNCGVVPVPEEELPVLLPENVRNWKPEGRSPLADIEEFVNTTCPKCKSKAKRETDTMDTFVDSSWYYLRYIDPKNDESIVDKHKERIWMNVDQYIGGAEHATKHLIYARFIYKFLHDIGVANYDEPFERLFTQGLVLKGFWWCKELQQSFFPKEEYDEDLHESIKEKFVEIYDIREEDGRKVGRVRIDGKEYEVEWQVEMMSKSKGNIVPIRPFIRKYGSDVARIAILFAGPPEKDFEWTEAIVRGADRFVRRTLELYKEIPSKGRWNWDDLDTQGKELVRTLHRNIKAIRQDLESFHFNTVIAKLMEIQNNLYAFKDKNHPVYRYALEMFALLVAPFAPHIAEEAWHRLGYEDSVFEHSYPNYDERYIQEEEVEIPVQINGKVRGRIKVSKDASEEEVLQKALSHPNIRKWIDGKRIARKVYVRNRMLSIVVEP